MTRMLFYQVTVNEPDVSVSTLTGLNVGVEKDRIIAVELKGNGPIPSYFERLDVKTWEIKPCLVVRALFSALPVTMRPVKLSSGILEVEDML